MVVIGPKVHHSTRELAPVVDEYPYRRTPSCNQSIASINHILASKPIANPNTNRFARKHIDNRKCAKLFSVYELIRNKIHGPCLVRPLRDVSQTVAPRLQGPEGEPNGAARAGGFSLHAGVDIAPNEREKLERLCRYVSRPPVASERLALTASGQVRYTLKTPYRDGTTHIVLEPLDLMARLAALVPKPRMHLTRYHGVFAPHSQYRAAVTPAHRGRGAATPPASEAGPTKVTTPRHVAMRWARRLKRVFGVEIESCTRCGGELKIIASIEEPQLIAKILSHLERAAPEQSQMSAPLINETSYLHR